MTSGFDGSMATSIAPVFVFAGALMSVQLEPPFIDLYSPRSPPGFHAGPSAATYTVFAFRGSTAMRPMCCDCSRPMCVQCRPPSVDLYMPLPGSMVLREFGSPVPAYTTFVSLGAMASMPNAETSLSSKSGRQVSPLFVDFQ